MIYSIAQRSAAGTTAVAAQTILTGANRIALLEAGVFLGAATASTFGLGKPAANGITATAQALFQAEDPNAIASVTNGVTTWTTSPTNPTIAHRRISLPATIGTGVIWTFPRGVLVPINANYVLQNLATNGVADSYFAIDE